MIRRIFYLLLASAFLLFSGGCGNSTQSNQADGFTAMDSRGKILHMKEKPTRIICTYIFADEILLDLVPHNRIIAMDKWIHDPGLSMAVEGASDVRKEVDNSPEHMVSLRPDLVIVGESQVKLIQSLEGAGLPVFVYKDAKLIQDIPEEVRMIGEAVGEQSKAKELVDDMERKLAEIDERVSRIPEKDRKRVMLVLRFGPIGGDGTIFHDVLTRAGTIDVYNDIRPLSIAGKGTSMILSREEFLQSDPDVIIMGNWSQGGVYKDSNQQLEEMYSDPAYSSMKAIREKNIIIMPQRNVNCLSHHVVDGIEAVYQAVYEGKAETP